MATKHTYKPIIEWTGNKGSGTFDYRSYSRSHIIRVHGKPDIQASSDSSFRGEANKHNPEDLFVSSISGCHMLWYLHLCADDGIVVLKYTDNAEGVLVIDTSGKGSFESINLHPAVVISPESSIDRAIALHSDAHKMCFLANSCKFPILHHPVVTFE